jgi:hypothetical protein
MSTPEDRMSVSAGLNVSVNDLKHQPISVVRTELPALAQALGVPPAELLRTLAGQGGLQEQCCHSDSW